MKKYILLTFFLGGFGWLWAQEKENDSILPVRLNEIVVIGKGKQLHEKQDKPLATLDEYLQRSGTVDLIKRGSYAWEPLINSMSTERTVISIDGMRIFGACTDKMDPVTSYVEISNLSEAQIQSGQQGSCHGPTIGGAIDLKRNNGDKSPMGFTGSVLSGYESNAKQRVFGGSAKYRDSSFYALSNVTYRKAENYRAGGNREINFSQFEKINGSLTAGYIFQKNQLLEASVIYDEARDVGYPALPMDVSLARAWIGSLKHVWAPKNHWIKHWETKLYANSITHIMDDSKRPDVPIRMDMPGWSDTYGYYSKIRGNKDAHAWTVNFNGFYNRSLAEMTMFSNNPNEPDMFMYTWPDIRTLYNGVFVEDVITLNCHQTLHWNLGMGVHQNRVNNDFGLASLQIFYPDMPSVNTRFLKSVGTQFNHHWNDFKLLLGAGYGERAPSVSEGYAFYIFNSYDLFDYIGNPNLKNEKSLETSVGLEYQKSSLKMQFKSSYFRLLDYIIGIPQNEWLPMTIGAQGIKQYQQLSYANLWHNQFSWEFKVLPNLRWNGQLVYSLGTDSENRNLPFLSPLQYRNELQFKKDDWVATASVFGNATQTQYSPFYGENRTPAYAIVNLSAGYQLRWEKQKLQIQTGVENALDTFYTTFADWNNVPRMGRNIFINLNFSFGE